MQTVIYQGGSPFRCFLLDLFTSEPLEVSEEEFFKVVGYNRGLIPMHYDIENINRQNFFLNDSLIAYRIRS